MTLPTNTFAIRFFKRIAALQLGALFLTSPVAADNSAPDIDIAGQRKIIGWVERIILLPEGLYIDSKMTPGSEGNVLHAEDVEIERKGEERFATFTTTDRKGATKTITRKITQTKKFRTSSGKREERVVVISGVCIDDKYFEVEFALDDRRKLDNEARIGREMLAGHFIIDPALTKTTTPSCKRTAE